jgi:hypothetical protein
MSKTIEAAGNEGWIIKPAKFSLSATAGVLSSKRTMMDMEQVWYNEWLGGREALKPDSIIFLCVIPPKQTEQIMDIAEVYITAEDMEGNDFLLYVGQPASPLSYNPDSTTTLRMQVTLANVDLERNWQFVYTQHKEIQDHNIDQNAHPDWARKFKKIGYPLYFVDHYYRGQFFDEYPSIDSEVENGDFVYLSSTDRKYYRAIAEEGEKSMVIGIVDKTDDWQVVLTGGLVQTAYHLPPYELPESGVLYLSESEYGKATNINTFVPLGVHIEAGLMILFPSPGLLKYAGIEPGGMSGRPLIANNSVYVNGNNTVLADASGGGFEIFLPLSPFMGDCVKIIDSKGKARSNNLIVRGQGAFINGSLEDFIIDVNFSVVNFIHDGGNNWIIDLGGTFFSLDI